MQTVPSTTTALMLYVGILAITGLSLGPATARHERAERALRDANEHLAAVIQSSPLAIYTLDPTSTVRTWNRAAEALYGWQAEEVIGRPLPTVAQDMEDHLRMRDRALRGEAVRGVEVTRRTKDGATINIRLSGATVHDAAGRGAVRADPGQLEQAIVNLVVNARDAMPQGGRLAIETADVELDRSYVAGHVPTQPGPYVLLAISDTGVGMDDATKARLFEPFFTTKEPGRGTGLGLATVYGIVKQSGGYIWAYSELGHGTTFKIYLPRVAETPVPPESTTGTPIPVRGSETVLVVEDQEEVRQLTKRVLEARGYAVLAARNGAEALEIVARHPTRIHLMITDVVMPGMNGRELAELACAKRSDLKVLYVSGYTGEAVLQHRFLEPGVAFLQKPFTPDALARKTREVLDNGRQA